VGEAINARKYETAREITKSLEGIRNEGYVYGLGTFENFLMTHTTYRHCNYPLHRINEHDRGRAWVRKKPRERGKGGASPRTALN